MIICKYKNSNFYNPINSFLKSSIPLLISILLFQVVDDLDDFKFIIIVHILSSFSLYFYWENSFKKYAEYSNFASVLLLISIFLKFFAILDIILYGLRIAKWPETIIIQESFGSLYFKGELISDFGLLLLVLTWELVIKKQDVNFSFLSFKVAEEVRAIPWLIYVACFVFRLFFYRLGFDFGPSQSFLVSINFMGTAVILVVCGYIRSFPGKIFTAIVMAFPLILVALETGMKENIFFPLVPCAIVAWNALKSLKFRLLLIVLGVAIFIFSHLIVNYTRNYNWIQKNSYSTYDVLSIIKEDFDFKLLLDSFESLMYRINLTSSHAIAVGLVERDGVQPAEIFGSIPLSLIPRVFWADKPLIQPGNLLTKRIYNINLDNEDIYSASTVGLFNALYLGGSYSAVFIGSVFYGFMLATLHLLALKFLSRFFLYSYNYMMFYFALRFSELHVSTAYTGSVLCFFSMIIMSNFFKLFYRQTPIRQAPLV